MHVVPVLIVTDGDIFKNVCGIAVAFLCRRIIIVLCCSLASHEDWLGNHTLTNMPHVCIQLNKQGHARYTVYSAMDVPFHHLKWIFCFFLSIDETSQRKTDLYW